MVEPLSPLGTEFNAGTFGQVGPDGAGVTLADHPWAAMVQVAIPGNSKSALVAAVQDLWSVQLPAAVGDSHETGPMRMAQVGADRYWLISETPLDLVASLTGKLSGGPQMALLDLSHGRHRFSLSGAKASFVLAKGVPMDLNLAPGTLVQTAIGHIQCAILVLTPGEDYHLMPARSFARTLFDWLIERGLETGINVQP